MFDVRFSSFALLLIFSAQQLSAAELATLTNDNWRQLAAGGKEADCILGDYVLRSDRIIAVVGQPTSWRHANMTARQVGGALIDLTLVEEQNDQLTAFYPGQRRQVFSSAEIVAAKGKKVVLHCIARAQAGDAAAKRPPQPEVQLTYELADGQPFILVRSVYKNPLAEHLDIALEDDLRADNFDAKAKAGPADLFWVHDRHFEQAYALIADRHGLITRSEVRNSVIQYVPSKAGEARIRLQPGQSYELVRRIFPGRHLLEVKGLAERWRGKVLVRSGIHLVDPAFKPIAGAEITLRPGFVPPDADDARVYGTARSDSWGWVRADLPAEKFTATIRSHGRTTIHKQLDLSPHGKGGVVNVEYGLEAAAMVVAEISDEAGRPIPCKVAFKGVQNTRDPNWGPPAAREAVVNLYYSPNGRFTVAIAPGSYEAIISHGPEYDVVRIPIRVEKSSRTALRATLRRAFDTPGWISADFHSHASPSGDNISDQRGRVLNLLAENIEFAPCTEHNRLDSYTPHLKALGAEPWMGTCPGIELTGDPLPLNHQNAFPLRLRPRTQDNGAPLTSTDPAAQIRRLAGWDEGAEKLIQQNHPDIGWLFFDRNGDEKHDGGYREGFPYMHVIEVHPIHEVLAMEPTKIYADSKGKKTLQNHTIFNWLQLLNQGHRIPGVVNTDAHYNFHGSGGQRNYVRCDARIPGEIDPIEIVRQCRRGRIVMSTGPYLEVSLNGALPGGDVRLSSKQGTLKIKVLCPNWFDIDRVQVLVNSRPAPGMNFTRQTHPGLFGTAAVRFQHAINLQLDKDAHIIVAAVGENSTVGEVMGPYYGRLNPAAISNPIYVDVDGGGFRPNGDTLGQPLPVKQGKAVP